MREFLFCRQTMMACGVTPVEFQSACSTETSWIGRVKNQNSPPALKPKRRMLFCRNTGILEALFLFSNFDLILETVKILASAAVVQLFRRDGLL